MNELLRMDKKRKKKLPRFQMLLRKAQGGKICNSSILSVFIQMRSKEIAYRNFHKLQYWGRFVYRSCLLYYNKR